MQQELPKDFEEIPIHTAEPQPLRRLVLVTPEAKARITRKVTLGVVEARLARIGGRS